MMVAWCRWLGSEKQKNRNQHTSQALSNSLALFSARSPLIFCRTFPASPHNFANLEDAAQPMNATKSARARADVPAPAAGKGKAAAKFAGDAGMVSNASLTEEEIERVVAPESAVKEEERLRAEREAAAAALPFAAPAEAVLTKTRADELDKLLNQTDLYTKFLSEQMESIEAKTEADAADAAAAAGDKRKGKGKEPAAKKAKPMSTKEFLPLIDGELRDYQLKGIKWLISLYQNGLNGILADQMGLGKTVQTIGFLSHLRSKGIHGPFLIVGPLSTLPNWVSEVQRWTPSIPVVLYHGSKDERASLRAERLGPPKAKTTEAFPIVVTSYEIVLADAKFLANYKWKYIVVDEGHRLKNMNCRLLRELRTIPTANKLLLTGTPLQNNLSELWSLLNFLLPDIFGSLADFESWFDFSAVGQEGGDKEILAQEQRNRVVTKLHSILKPFLLRRIKTDVETSLPAKTEIVLYAPMAPKQKELNDQLRDRTLADALSKMAKSRSGAASALNNVLMQMRKVANHPDLITSQFEDSLYYPPPEVLVEQCGKMHLLDRLLNKLHSKGHKVLIFSQMTKMLDLIDSYLDARGLAACRIDGNISWQDRQDAMKRFNTDPSVFAFLLSTRAGGLGINLTAADTVIIYDSDWNPHNDLQAMDRCHRIGQQKPVLVFRLATAHSIEGSMLRRANSKMALERLVIKKGAFLPDLSNNAGNAAKSTAGLSAEELAELLKNDTSLEDLPQSTAVSDKNMDKLLNRKHMETGAKMPYETQGPGWEVVAQLDGSGLLSSVQ